jgi:hypothetical protein
MFLPANRTHMLRGKSSHRWSLPFCLALAVGWLGGPCVRAQAVNFAPEDFQRQLLLPIQWDQLRPATDISAGRANRFHLFQMPTGYAKEAVGLDLDDDTPPGEIPLPVNAPTDDSPNWIQLNVGADNPYFDFRRPGDPGGVGYYRLHSQLQLLDTGRSGMSLALGAVTPAGLENDGVANGPTIFTPAVACYRDLWDGMTVQAFVGNNLRANTRSIGRLERNVRAGLAAQHALPFSPFTNDADTDPSMFVFVEALGRYRFDGTDPSRFQRPPLELLPGIHWRVRENWWISGGLIVPLSAPRPENNLWQLTCSWQF